MNKGYCMDMYKKSYSSFSNNNNNNKKKVLLLYNPHMHSVIQLHTIHPITAVCLCWEREVRESLTERPRDSHSLIRAITKRESGGGSCGMTDMHWIHRTQVSLVSLSPHPNCTYQLNTSAIMPNLFESSACSATSFFYFFFYFRAMSMKWRNFHLIKHVIGLSCRCKGRETIAIFFHTWWCLRFNNHNLSIGLLDRCI